MMDDLISRKEALKVCEKYNGQGYVWSCIRSDIEKLPSTQPNAPNTLDAISREEAMKICRRMVWNGADDYLPLSAKAIENEIRKLPSIKVCETEPSDLISRQDAIYAISKDIMGGLNYKRILKELPSAEPRHNFPEKTQLSGEDTTSDCISRQAAIDALKNRWKKTRNYEGNGDDIAEECELYLKQVPSAQPEIVWCKDCLYGLRGIPYRCRLAHGTDSENWYCADAERRTNG